SALHLQLLRQAVLGSTGAVAEAVAPYVRRQCDDADSRYDWRAGSPHADAAERGVLRGAQIPRCSDRTTPLRGRVPWHGLEAVQLHAHAALYDVVVQTVETCAGWNGGHGGCRRAVTICHPE